MTEPQLGYTASPCKVHRCEDEHNQPWTERGATTGVDCPLLPVLSSTQLSPLPCHSAYLWLRAQKGLEVGKGARARRDWGSLDQEEAMLIHPLPLVLPRSWDSMRTCPCQLLSPLLVAYRSLQRVSHLLVLSLSQSLFSKHLLLLNTRKFQFPALVSIIAK